MPKTALMEKIFEFIGHELRTTISANFLSWAPYVMNKDGHIETKVLLIGHPGLKC